MLKRWVDMADGSNEFSGGKEKLLKHLDHIFDAEVVEEQRRALDWPNCPMAPMPQVEAQQLGCYVWGSCEASCKNTVRAHLSLQGAIPHASRVGHCIARCTYRA